MSTAKRSDTRVAYPTSPARRVLVTEQSPASQRAAIDMLKRRGHDVTVADGGREALAALTRQKFDVVLMDVQMSEIDGFEMTAVVRACERFRGGHQRIIAIARDATRDDLERWLTAGMDGYVSKPLDPRALVALVEEVIEGNEERRAMDVPSLGVLRS